MLLNTGTFNSINFNTLALKLLLPYNLTANSNFKSNVNDHTHTDTHSHTDNRDD